MSETTEASTGRLSAVGRGLGLGTVAAGGADWLEGAGLDKTAAVVRKLADGLFSGGGEAAETAGMLVPYLMDMTGVVL